jgi:hypothetical protein
MLSGMNTPAWGPSHQTTKYRGLRLSGWLVVPIWALGVWNWSGHPILMLFWLVIPTFIVVFAL